MATEPIAYGGISSAQRGARGRSLRTIRINNKHHANESNLSYLDADVEEEKRERDAFCGKPTSRNAPAKPSPCRSPNVNATIHGHRFS